ncbi:MAG TPA: bifunctional precorrin-2 dehydrogenase/sirohydrochlorin ferrochelatase, partial [Armatimonadota bacterium]
MPSYPINLQLKNRKCVVIGGGAVAERKVESLLEYGASVHVAAPQLTPALQALADAGRIDHSSHKYAAGMLIGAFLAVASTNDPEVNRSVSLDAQVRGVLVNVVDDPELCTFFMPAIVRRGELVIGVSTSGR